MPLTRIPPRRLANKVEHTKYTNVEIISFNSINDRQLRRPRSHILHVSYLSYFKQYDNPVLGITPVAAGEADPKGEVQEAGKAIEDPSLSPLSTESQHGTAADSRTSR